MTEINTILGPMPELSAAEEQRVHAYISAITSRAPADRRDFEAGRLGARFAMLYQVVSTGDYRRSGSEALSSALRQL